MSDREILAEIESLRKRLHDMFQTTEETTAKATAMEAEILALKESLARTKQPTRQADRGLPTKSGSCP